MKNSKKHGTKLAKQQLQETRAEYMGWAQDVMDDVDDFLETATPFEISKALTEIGVSTSHRAGIEEILQQTANERVNSGMQPEEMVREFVTHLLNHWKSELKLKDRSTDMDDFVFLLRTAWYFTCQWITTQVRISANTAPVMPGLLKQIFGDFHALKRSSSG